MYKNNNFNNKQEKKFDNRPHFKRGDSEQSGNNHNYHNRNNYDSNESKGKYVKRQYEPKFEIEVKDSELDDMFMMACSMKDAGRKRRENDKKHKKKYDT